jgi:hypothetical protein
MKTDFCDPKQENGDGLTLLRSNRWVSVRRAERSLRSSFVEILHRGSGVG